MKQIYLLAMLLAISGAAFGQQICTVDPTATKNGLTPDSLTGIAPATVNTFYSQEVTIIVPTDTQVVFGGAQITADVDSIKLVKVDGLPVWMTLECSTPDCGFAGGTKGCAILYGTPPPGSEGSYPLDIIVTGYAKSGGFSLPPITDTAVGYYTLEIDPPAGVYMPAHTEMSIFATYSGRVSLVISGKTPEEINWQLVDVLGRIHETGILRYPDGQVEITHLSNVPPGIYFIVAEVDGERHVKKLSWTPN